MFTFILFVIVILCSLHYLFYHNSFAKSLLTIPGPPIKFFFGNSLDVLLSPVELFILSCKWEKMYKDIHRFYAYFHGSICIYNPEDIEVIVSSMKYHEKSSLYRFLKPWLQEGLLLSNGPKWQQRRKILTPAFHFNVLQKYYSALEDNSERLINVLEKTDGDKIDIVPVISEYTLNTICETAMGTQLTEETADAGKSYKEAIYNLGYLLLKRFVNLLLHPDFSFKLSPIGRKQSKYLAIIRKFTEKVIKERKDKVVNARTVNDSNVDLSKQKENFFPKTKKERNAMLDLLIAAERDGLIDETGIQEEVDTFMFEGHDTTATGLTYILMTLANEEEIQAKVVEELKSIFGEDTRAASMDDLNNMRYLDRCIKESLRLYPPVPFISRSIPTDTVLSGYKIPAGTICNIHIYHLHRQEHLFKNALKFDPDRFLPENSVGRHNYSYIPFSAGPRNCIGQKFAMMEMKLALSAILRNFKLIPVTKPTDLQFASDLVLRNAGPVYMKFAKKTLELFAWGQKCASSYNGIFRLYAYLHGSVCIYNPDDIEVIASSMKYHEKSNMYKFLKPWLQEGLLLSNGPKWQHRRKILTPAFHFNVLQKYHAALEDNSKRLIRVLENTNEEAIDIVPVISEYTLNTICETAMGTQLSEETAGVGKLYKEAVYKLSKLILKRFSNIFLHPDFTFRLSSIHRQQSKYLSIVRKFTENVIKQRKKNIANFSTMINDRDPNMAKQKKNLSDYKREKNPMLDLLISAERDGLIDEAGIQEEVDTFMFEGHDTTAAGLTYCLLSLANDEEVQAKVVEELKSIFGEDSRAASMDDLNQMRYLDRCIKESMRLYPPVPFINRSIPVDTVLSGYKIPAGTICHIQIYYLHRQEHLFKNALKFDPDRFLPENSVGRHNYAYIPFSAGPRNCIGQKFAMMEMKSALSAILRNFKLVPVTKHNDLQFSSDLILRNSGPVNVKFVKRSSF